MAFDNSITLTFSHGIEISDSAFLLRLDTKQPYDRMTDMKGWFTVATQEWTTIAMDWPITVNFFNGRATSNAQNRGFIPYLGELETVNFQQWKGQQPYTLMTKSGKPFETERTQWEIVAVEQVDLERMGFAFTHADKDQVFRLQMRLAQIFGTVKQFLKPWEDVAHEHFVHGYETLSDVPEGQQEASKEMLDAIKQEWAENTPIWAK